MKNSNTYIAIMAGGVGSRFWPSSREQKPKQFLDILGVGKSLLRMTFERFLNIVPASNILILTNEIYKDLVLEHLPELSENQILLEPSRNNTAPCIAYTALRLKVQDPEAVFVVAPSDHIILKEDAFTQNINKALDFADQHDVLITLGIAPTRPDTGYGYINYLPENENGIHKVKRFAEKPDLDTARFFLASGDYLWNAGIFVWKAENVLKALRKYAGGVLDVLEKGISDYNTPSEKEFIKANYPNTPNISIDFAIMEKAENVYTIPSDLGWSDLGTWASLYAECEKDEHENANQATASILMDTKNCLVRSSNGKLVVIKGLEDYIVIDEPDVLMIYPKSKEQEVKQVTQAVEKQFGGKFS